jgi:hypothetical protein
MNNITEGIMEFKTLEQRIFKAMCQAACETMRQSLQRCDQIIKALRDTKEYALVDPAREKTIKTKMGEVAYRRAYYRKKSGGYVFLLDEAMGIESGCGLVSENLAEQIVVECTEKSFRKAADTISNLTGQTISAMGAWNVLQQYGEKVEAREKRLRELDSCGVTGQLGNVGSRVIFQEMDDVWLSMQKEKRQKAGAPAGEGVKKPGKKPVHVATAYTGWAQEKDGRYMTVDKIDYASFRDAKGFVSDFEALLRHRFDMDGVERRVANGDGASWIRAAAEDSDAVFQLDPFHRSRAVIRAVSDKEARKAVFDAIREKDAGKALRAVCDLIGKAADNASREKLVKLFGYFSDNKDCLLTWQERGIELPAPPAGVVYRNLGVQEASNCDLITHRMKHRKGSWSVQGAGHMAKILSFRHTIGFDAMLGPMPEPGPEPFGTLPEPLSAAKTPLCDGKGNGGEWLHAGMPFDQAFATHGREAIRGLLSQRPLSDLSFL